MPLKTSERIVIPKPALSARNLLSAASETADSIRLRWWKRFTWRHPEWWIFGLSLLAWLTIIVRFDATGIGLSLAHLHHHGNASLLWLTEMRGWMVMIVAMMLPLVATSARNAAAMSLWSRRHRAIAGFVLGYLSIWLIIGIIISLVISILRLHGWLDPRIAITTSFCLAVLWEFTSIKKRALLACHRTIPIAPTGWRANLDCVRYGWMIGGSCLISCWALMVMCSLAGHNLAIMLLATIVGVTERYPILRIKKITFG